MQWEPRKLHVMCSNHGVDVYKRQVHEMAKDEARHGKGFEGLLKRYFG